ncbi:TetR/AcrR family transcriptional regulator [Ornithinimicrobium ciconiae]|uniref:TetR/AcrR family transcriptional regulator n=1 Tax=Ornithinimicrobium ciconiae TaxID=2594265 RepID=A0A516GB61_9MICO|nr:TetR/AcrR family transcriptional regulator [Ornithinimicrobium ciconiae]QDO88766.1 TetR/AcrR family transcriptional regulator [Ornithinimicrobium ciconiae]
MSQTRQQVLEAARRLFGERGYAAVTIREIAAAAGVSPAMVMKVGGSKEQLHVDATPLEPEPLPPDVPLEGLGELLVSRMLSRRQEGGAEPWLRAIYLIADAPDPEAARGEFRDRFLSRFALPEGSAAAEAENRRHCDQLACLMVGLAAGTRTLHLLDYSTDRAALVQEYGALVQQVVDRISATREAAAVAT